MNLFSKKPRAVPQTYQPVLEAAEVIELFSRLTLHHQAALLRLISRNLVIEVDGDQHMGFEFDYGVDGAMVSMRPLASEPEA
jgi:hypothetical protein